jgi:hypothetical protein
MVLDFRQLHAFAVSSASVQEAMPIADEFDWRGNVPGLDGQQTLTTVTIGFENSSTTDTTA